MKEEQKLNEPQKPKLDIFDVISRYFSQSWINGLVTGLILGSFLTLLILTFGKNGL
jgi:hypothetical protein